MPRRNLFGPRPGPRRRAVNTGRGPKSPFANAMAHANKPIEIKTPQVDLEGLKDTYSWMTINKDLGFKMVMDWFAANTPFLLYKDPLDADRQKAYDRAMASVKLAESTHADEERDTAYRTALRLLITKVWPNKGLMTLQEGEALTEPTEKVKQVQTVLSTLNTAFTGKVQFRMTLMPERRYQQGEVLLPKAEVESLIPKTPLQIVLNEVPTVAKVLSIESTPEGEKLNGAKFMETLPILNNEIAIWAMNDRSLTTKTIGKAPAAPRTAKPFDPNAPVTPGFRVPRAGNIVVLNANLVPHVSGNRKQALEAGMQSTSIADLKTKLTAMGGRMDTYVSYVVKTLVDAGAIEVK